MEGWIKLYRQSMENELYFSEPFTRWQAWVDLLLLANTKRQVLYKRGVRVVVERGQVALSQGSLATRWKWGSRGRVQRFLNDLKIDQMVDQVGSNVSQVVVILNYDSYQNSDPVTLHKTDSRRTVDGHKTDSKRVNEQEGEEGKKERRKEVSNSLRSLLTSDCVKLISSYILEEGIQGVDAAEFVDYYAAQNWTLSNGRPMKDWRAAVRNWSRRSEKNGRGNQAAF